MRYAVATIAYAAIAISAPASGAPLPKAKAKPAAPKQSPTERMVDELLLNSTFLGMEHLPKSCELSSTRRLSFIVNNFFSDKDFSKNEFETTEDYKTRITNIENAINGDRDTIICIPMKDNSYSIKYDADKQIFSVRDYRLRNIESHERDTGSYISSTKMGVKARVYQEVRIDINADYGTEPIGWQLGCSRSYVGDLNFPVPSGQAPDIRAQGYMVIIGHLRAPFATKTESSGKPTLDDPFDTYQVTYTLKLKPTNILIVSPSGEQFPCTR